jgi:hypothetical protein
LAWTKCREVAVVGKTCMSIPNSSSHIGGVRATVLNGSN